ncbi:beta-ketoacyl-[acyl-carrier-protein] synthase family protein [Pararhodospirillum oryzae]|uniref:3-oxoacyl-ACP synthase II n=1 Tax=Pararhodospirillum oryzae TaxID=478448 RepID=A0A512HA52_9PROT|nr:beta-ketoacyl-[acyl-carrier-protein] synthase family protein [Pararhodospirillum oryzae]GEO82308.1 3-oxoacyl-ACP synthase II [Pararhodospirillum oryzae]
MARKVLITGMGCLSPLGNDTDSFWHAVVSGRCAIRPLEHPEGRFIKGVKTFAPLVPYDPAQHFEPRRLMWLDPFAQIAILAARQACAQAGLSQAPVKGHRVGVVIGSTVGGKTTEDQGNRLFWTAMAEDRAIGVDPMGLPRAMMSSPVSTVGMEFGFTGPTFCVSSACASSNHAIGVAFWLVRAGVIDVAVTGGADICSPLTFLKGWEALRVLSPDLCRPFCAERRGLVLGEGAGILVLEAAESARARGARGLAEVRGFGMTADAGDITRPSVEGTSGAILAALEDGGLAPEDIDYVNAHGSGTRSNDEVETQALHKVFGPHAGALSVSSTKSMIGHAMGAAGALELIATVMAVQNDVVPPTANFGTPTPECDLDYTPHHARPRPLRAALSDNFAFGGLNAVLAVSRCE